MVLAPPDPLTVTVGVEPLPMVVVDCDGKLVVADAAGEAGDADPDGPDPGDGPVDAVDPGAVAPAAVAGCDAALGVDPGSDELESGPAHASPGVVATAAPMPSATASAPTRPT